MLALVVKPMVWRLLVLISPMSRAVSICRVVATWLLRTALSLPNPSQMVIPTVFALLQAAARHQTWRVTGSTFTIDDSLGYDPAEGDYHSAIYIRAGATETIDISDNTINAEVVNFSPVVNLDTIYGANTWLLAMVSMNLRSPQPQPKVNMSPGNDHWQLWCRVCRICKCDCGTGYNWLSHGGQF